jgi:4-alpha-glucanotransferase
MAQRASGVLLHPTSLPGPYGIGDLGPAAEEFGSFLSDSGQTYWQILPLGPTGLGNSPYSSYSAFAGNPLLISPERLAEEGLLDRAPEPPPFPADAVDHESVRAFKEKILRDSFRRFARAGGGVKDDYGRFLSEHESWLKDYALFSALKAARRGAPWTDWEPELARAEPAALAKWADKLAEELDYQRYIQFLFFRQWGRLKNFCRAKGLMFLGDVPIYVAHDSADVWMNQPLFKLEADGRPRVVAGVPPDYFSETGQRWGNPVYDWDASARTRYEWWTARFRQCLRLVDMVRLDHFLGFHAYWEIPAAEPNAVKGRWTPGPGRRFFDAMKRKLGGLPFVAENLGAVTPEAEDLRKRCGLPGMSILEFSFSPDYPPSHPYNHPADTFVYTGTHDNDTVQGWLRDPAVTDKEKQFALKYTAADPADLHWALIRVGHSLPAQASVVPVQDLLGKGSEARMNYPGKTEGNWRWRFRWEELTPEIRIRFGELTWIYGRTRAEDETA